MMNGDRLVDVIIIGQNTIFENRARLAHQSQLPHRVRLPCTVPPQKSNRHSLGKDKIGLVQNDLLARRRPKRFCYFVEVDHDGLTAVAKRIKNEDENCPDQTAEQPDHRDQDKPLGEFGFLRDCRFDICRKISALTVRLGN